MRPPARRRTHPWLRLLLLVGLLLVVVIGAYGGWLAGQAGRLPWQEEPTRISTQIEPFSGIPGFGTPAPTPDG